MAGDAERLVRDLIAEFNESMPEVLRGAADLPGETFAEEPEIVPLRAMVEDTVFRGPTAIADFSQACREIWSELSIELESVRPVAEHAVAVGVLKGRGRAGGAAVEMRVAFAITVADGRIRRLVTLASEDEALASVEGR